MSALLHKKHHWLPAGRPGHRFRNRYYEHQKSGRHRGLLGMILRFLLAGMAAMIGFILVFMPGPAVLFFLIAGALLAADWLPVARLLDWGELHVRRLAKHAKRFWDHLTLPARVALGMAAATVGAAASYGSYLLVR
jgi:hypothetical protein